ncbi:Nose resistant to fluoxetine protein 6 [Diplonema papillatum]|nr:Nose resistant to fluoxetine protein 6 [Diplonema papillatum]|eukprot:gene6340-9714_t
MPYVMTAHRYVVLCATLLFGMHVEGADCKDDAQGWLRTSGSSCADLLHNDASCSRPLKDVGGAIQAGIPREVVTAKMLRFCPVSCQACDEAAREWPTEVCLNVLGDEACDERIKAVGCDGATAVGGDEMVVNMVCRSKCRNCLSSVNTDDTSDRARHACADDPYGLLAKSSAGFSCPGAVAALGCNAVVLGSKKVHELCPASCGSCGAADFTRCADKAAVAIGPVTANCATLLSMVGCETQAKQLSQNLPATVAPEMRVRDLCPSSCATCKPPAGDAGHCRPFALDEAYLMASGTRSPKYRQFTPGGITLRGGYSGDAPACSESSRFLPLGAKTCTVSTVGGMLALCVPRECSSHDLRDFLLELGGGFDASFVYFAVCEDESLEEFEWSDTKTVLAIGFFVSLAVFVVLGTAGPFGYCAARVRNQTGKRVLQGLDRFVGHWNARSTAAALLAHRATTTQKGSYNTSFLDFWRSISIMWVVVGHTYIFFATASGWTNPSYVDERLLSPITSPIATAPLAVDTFFWLSGFVGTLMITRTVAKNPWPLKSNVLMAFATVMAWVQRWLRLVPMIGAGMLIGIYIFPLLGSGSQWWRYSYSLIMNPASDSCEKYWWRHFLFVNDSYHWPGSNCFGWLWYVSDDFHFSMVLPVALFPYLKLTSLSQKWADCYIAVVLLATIASCMYLSYSEKLTRESETYVRPYLRIAPYCFGVGAALVLKRLVARDLAKDKNEEDDLRAEEMQVVSLEQENGTDGRPLLPKDEKDEEVSDEKSDPLKGSDEVCSMGHDDVYIEPANPLRSSAESPDAPDNYAHLQTSIPVVEPEATPAVQLQRSVAPLVRDGDWIARCCAWSSLNNTAFRTLMYLVAGMLMGSCLFFLWKRESASEAHTGEWSPDAYALYNLWYLSSWGLGLSILSIVFARGHGGLLSEIMSHAMWAPLGRLAFGVYLLHPLLVFAAAASQHAPTTYSDYHVLWNWAAVCSLSFSGSCLLWLLVEQPFATLCAALLKR